VADGGDEPRDDAEGAQASARATSPEPPARYETPTEQRARLREEREHRRRRRFTEAGVALAALVISCAVFLVNGALFFRGSDMAVLEPDTVLFYRDPGPNGSSMWVALPAQMINAASADYGDVVTEASLAIGPKRTERGRFGYLALAEPVMSPNVEKGVADCAQGARCIPATGFFVIERPRTLLDVPGGGSRSANMAFMIEAVNCEGEPGFCSAMVGFDDALSHLRSRPDPMFRMTLRFHFDGAEEVRCRLTRDPIRRKAIFDYLQEKGWAQAACEKD
jgi:hypothetical protein